MQHRPFLLRHWAIGWMVGWALCAQAQPRQVIEIGAEDDAAPLAYADGSGFVADVVKAALAHSGWEVRLKVLPYARCKALAQNGLLAGCYSTCRTPDLEGKLLFPNKPIYESRNVLLTTSPHLKGCDPSQWPSGTRIGIVRGYEYTSEVHKLLNAAGIRPSETDSEISNLRKLEAGRLDATVVTLDKVKRIEFIRMLAHTTAPVKELCLLGKQPAFVAFSPKHPMGARARDAFDQGLNQLIQDGRLQQLEQDWRARSLARASAKRH
ncbi:substrate-binding periplasmic protein [Aquabacterium sp.]|uniref:substrate-binding periplasmic protein n=1 Tax=Aquabacterium sp. TaxID=1872578 RepID=UPI002E364354|nr:transporter substrate-binding domain-containing protein [Aquabacterium sp.]HEX5310833.1 transporter substrate-binding domain-containing protein [Aquabacterium sp.]